MNEPINNRNHRSQVQEFFSGKSIFITGGTGFLGSVILEKLLRSCPDVHKIYVLIRGKRGEDAQNRLQKLINCELFSQQSPENLAKIIAVEGDISLPGLGLSPQDTETLVKNVSVIFHVAATTNFSSHLRQAVTINLQGTKRVLELAHQIPNLEVLLYTSTAYCNAIVRGNITEAVYPSWLDGNDLIETINGMTDSQIEKETKQFLGGHPNTYSFTKHLAENLLNKERRSIPIAVIRPSVVLGTWEEPMPGWVENVQNGGVAFMAGAGKGVFRTVLGINDKISDIVPCDMVANLSIAAAWEVAKEGKGSLKVYHCTSGIENPITWDAYCNLTIEKVIEYPCTEVIWYPSAKCRINILRNCIFIALYHLLPALLLQFWEKVTGKNRPIVSYQQKFVRGMTYVYYFTTKNWYFDTKNTNKLAQILSLEDKAMFNFDVTKIHWPSYIERCVLGVRHYYHGDYPKSIEKARTNMRILRIIHYTAYAITFAAVFYLLSTLGVEFWSSVLGASVAFVFLLWL